MMFNILKLVVVAVCSLVVRINAMNYDRELFLDHDELLSVPDLLSGDAASQRWLGGENNAQYLVYDEDGVAYDPYSLAWRYLGVYIDCNADNDGGNSRDNHRRLGSHSNDNGGCKRKLLWAAYVDPKYDGNYIEEYRFYNIATREWDNSTCLASGEPHRCVNLNCHEPHTKFKLVGVFKETNGLYDWFEQLFKHQGTCIWNDEDVYDTMETWMEKFPSQCTKLSVKDYSGNAIYMSTHPLPEGNMTIGIYTDNTCLTLSEEIDYASYIVMYYENYYKESWYYRYYGYNSYYYQRFYEMGQEAANGYATAIETWNEYMSQFKICQPCKAYNLQSDKQDKNKHKRRGRRKLENDGDGSETARYNCKDEAGYTNVNQCYKFETKTKMTIAVAEDLQMASELGTILRIKAYGRWYGEGGYSSEPEIDVVLMYITVAALATSILALFVCGIIKCCRRIADSVERRRIAALLLEDSLCDDEEANYEKYHDKSSTNKPARRGKREHRRRQRRRRQAKSVRDGFWSKLATKIAVSADKSGREIAKSVAYTPPPSPTSTETSDDSLPSQITHVNVFEVNLTEMKMEEKDLSPPSKTSSSAGSWWNVFGNKQAKVKEAINAESYDPPLQQQQQIDEKVIKQNIVSMSTCAMTESPDVMLPSDMATPPLSPEELWTPLPPPQRKVQLSMDEDLSEVPASDFVSFDSNPFEEIKDSSEVTYHKRVRAYAASILSMVQKKEAKRATSAPTNTKDDTPNNDVILSMDDEIGETASIINDEGQSEFASSGGVTSQENDGAPSASEFWTPLPPPERKVQLSMDEDLSEDPASDSVYFDCNPFEEIKDSSKSGSSEFPMNDGFIGDINVVEVDDTPSDESQTSNDGSEYSCTSSEAREQLDHGTFLRKLRREKRRSNRQFGS